VSSTRDAGKVVIESEASGFGARVSGLDLRSDVDERQRAALGRAWAEHSVLVFPGQPMDIDDLERVTTYFGDFGEDPFVAPLADHPHVIEVRREADEKSIVFGAAWHSDWSFQATPPAGTLLHAQVVPPVGGNTLYADTTRAYEALSPEWKQRVKDMQAIHSASAAYGVKGVLAQDPQPSSMAIVTGEAAHEVEVHPVVRVHPVSGRRSLFVNPVYTRAIDGKSEEESQLILASLYSHMLKDEFVYEHHWSADMLAIWDNRCTMHLAKGGYEGHRRLLYRTTVAGERPV
jgi:taurine dioxygenase